MSAVFMAGLSLSALLLYAGCAGKPQEKCSLSLCDCKCYPEGKTPEQTTGLLCGINCLGEKGVSGCEYRDGKCSETYAAEKNCSSDSDCAKEGSRCADGVDPYHVCQEGRCTQLTFIADPCKTSHVCPKGAWDQKTEDSCFDWANCKDAGCNDNSDTTKDECVYIGSRSEGCRYTILKDDSCSSDSDCVPAQCCHPKACVNKKDAPNCEGMACTMVCMGPIDCGMGRCACSDNKCIIETLKTK